MRKKRSAFYLLGLQYYIFSNREERNGVWRRRLFFLYMKRNILRPIMKRNEGDWRREMYSEAIPSSLPPQKTGYRKRQIYYSRRLRKYAPMPACYCASFPAEEKLTKSLPWLMQCVWRRETATVEKLFLFLPRAAILAILKYRACYRARYMRRSRESWYRLYIFCVSWNTWRKMTPAAACLP